MKGSGDSPVFTSLIPESGASSAIQRPLRGTQILLDTSCGTNMVTPHRSIALQPPIFLDFLHQNDPCSTRWATSTVYDGFTRNQGYVIY